MNASVPSYDILSRRWQFYLEQRTTYERSKVSTKLRVYAACLEFLFALFCQKMGKSTSELDPPTAERYQYEGEGDMIKSQVGAPLLPMYEPRYLIHIV